MPSADLPPDRPFWTLATLTVLLAAAAFQAPLVSAHPARLTGLLLLGGAAAEALHGFRRTTFEGQRAAWTSSAVTTLFAALLLHAPWIASTALALFVAAPFAVDGARYAVATARLRGKPAAARRAMLGAAGNLAVVAAVVILRELSVTWTIAIAGGLRLLGTTWELLAQPVFTPEHADETVLADLALHDSERMAALGTVIEREELVRGPVDRAWVLSFVAVLFAIHIGRMGFDRSPLGILSPVVAVLGDLAIALGIAFFGIVPARLALRRVTRRLERRAWRWALESPGASPIDTRSRRLVRAWLESRLRFAIRLRAARYSLRDAITRGLRMGLPLATILVATVPVWGMSWYFDTENWAAGIWNSWAGSRTDTWRAAMVRGVTWAGLSRADGTGFQVHPAGLGANEPFSFIVIGDPGEGDASQHVLRDQLIRAAAADDVRFVVISSDVVYPTGAMKDYEARFWLPFKGITRPVYAIPGNHDWYDALEGFVATFFEPDAARAAIGARIEVDERLTSTTTRTIEQLIAEASRLRREYRVPTGFQQAPFFQVQADGFALLAVDTGVLRRVDDEQRRWLTGALQASRGKLIMVVLGHPFLAAGLDQTADDPGFADLHQLFRDHGVRVVMAGDTHDLEYYREPPAPDGGGGMVHVVNGGGGAYLSFGTALAWPPAPVTAEWAFYPSRQAVVEKIRSQTPWWKRPAWWWTSRMGAWPFSAEWLSAAFDANVAPFFQSFVVVTVEPAERRLRMRPWGVHGPLTWRELDHPPDTLPAGAGPDDLVEWVVE